MKIKYKWYRKENNCHFGKNKQVISEKQKRPYIKEKKLVLERKTKQVIFDIKHNSYIKEKTSLIWKKNK